MKHLSVEAKHHILLEYSAADATRSFAALAARHHIKGGREAVRQWHLRWNGTAAERSAIRYRESHSGIQSRCMLRQHREGQSVRDERTVTVTESERALGALAYPCPACLSAHVYAYARRVCRCMREGRELTFDSTEKDR